MNLRKNHQQNDIAGITKFTAPLGHPSTASTAYTAYIKAAMVNTSQNFSMKRFALFMGAVLFFFYYQITCWFDDLITCK
jgi:hypothetical protein